MNTFHHFLCESVNGKNTHIEHLEDVILHDPIDGGAFALSVLRQFEQLLVQSHFSHHMFVSTKFDGAPAIVFGPDPADQKFFVATKYGAFAKSPKLAKTHDDIEQMYTGTVKNVLHTALTELAALHSEHILQGDVLYDTSLMEMHTINGKDYITFRPNTIMYAVDANSELGIRIRNSVLGIVLHTVYMGEGPSLLDYCSYRMDVNIFASLTRSRRVVVLDAAFAGVSDADNSYDHLTFTKQEKSDFQRWLFRASIIHKTLSLSVTALTGLPSFQAILQKFVHQQVREQNIRLTIRNFELYLLQQRIKEMSARKSLPGQERIGKLYDQFLADVTENSRLITNLFELHYAIVQAKLMILQKLGQFSQIATFLPTETGYKVTEPEGYVVTSQTGKVVKIVNRMEFSHQNFVNTQSWANN